MIIFMRRIIGVILTVVMLLTTGAPVWGAEYYDTENTAYAQAADFLSALGIMEGRDDGSFAPEESVTRAEVCDVIMKIMRKSPQGIQSIAFDDVSKNYWAYDAIAYLSSVGIISGDGNKFYPERNMTYYELFTALARFLGYSAYAEAAGGYPNGYMDVAKRAQLMNNMDGVNYDEAVNRGNLAVICANTMEAPVSELKGQENDGVVFASGRTVMELYWDMGKISGIINGVYGTCEGGVILPENQVLIDGQPYWVQAGAWEEKLGWAVEAYYQEAEDGQRTILYGDFERENTVYTIDAEDFIEAADYRVTYADGRRDKTLRLSRSIDIVKNGVFLPAWDDFDIFQIVSGDLTLIDNNRDGLMDYALIREVSVFVVNRVDVENGLIYDNYDRQQVLDLETGAPFVRLRTDGGQEGKIEDIARYDVLNVVKTDGVYYDVTITRKTAEGTVTGIVPGDRILQMGETEYLVDYGFWQREERDWIRTGEKYTFLLDSRGYVCGYLYAGEDSIIPACLISVRELEDQEGLAVRFKLFNLITGETEVLFGAEKIRVDGYSCKTFEQVYQALALDTGGNKPRGMQQVLLYQVNGEQRINSIDTAEKTARENGESLQYAYEKKERVYRSAYNCFDKTFVVSDATIFAAMSTTEQDPEEIYSKERKSDYTTDYYVCETYRYGKFNGYESILLRIMDQSPYYIRGNSLLGMVSDVGMGLNAEDEPCYMLTIAQKGGIVNKFMAQRDFEACGGAERGDTIRFSEKDGQIKNIEVIYDYDGSEPITWEEKSETSSDGKSVFEYKYVYDVYDDVIALSETPGDTEALTYLIPSKSVVILYDREKDVAKMASMEDIRGYVSDGQNCSRVIVQWKSNEPSVIAVYR